MLPGNPLAAVFSNHKLVCFDVGALNGFRGLELLHPFTELYGFEPEETACVQLNQSIYPAAGFYKAKAWPIALSDKNGEEPFYIAGNGAMNSLLKPVPEQFDVYFGEAAGSKYWREQLELKHTRTVKTETADQFCATQNITHIDLLKLDAQGAELQVLAGAAKLLENNAVSIIKTEVALYSVYENQCLFGDMDVFLRSRNYELIDCTFTPEQVFDAGEKAVKHETELYEKTRFFPVGDAVYVKHAGALTTDQAQRAACVLLYWGYTGVARKLLARNPDYEQSEQLLKQFAGLQQQPPKSSALKGWVPPVLWSFLKKMRRG